MSGRPPLAGLSAVKLALMARKAREQSAQVLRADPIAIVGMACRAPGGADTPRQLWQLLCDARDAVREVPADRWDAAAWFDPDPSAAAKACTRQGGFLDRIDGFDAAYFNLLPREAERMDPQQRLLLEVAIEGIDDAGIPQQRLRGTRTGVYIASYHNDYAALQYRDLDAVDARTLTGTLHSVLTNRLSYILDLKGPSMSIDTACSSSLVAVHLACQALRSGEVDVALAGGVSLMVTPDLMVSMSKVGFMAPDGRCKSFDALADGFGRGEGCGVVVLKRLSDAIADADRVLAVIRGSAVNSDGYSTLLAAPNGLAQQAMIREALDNAQLTADRIGYVEAHGTGTALGDPVEVEALAATVGRPAPGAGTCHVGSIKANLGHMEAAAGVIGLIKSVLVLQNEQVPRQVHFSRLNPHIRLEQTRLAIPTMPVHWPRGPQPRCAAVSSFGVGGTNAHVIVEESLDAAGDPAGTAGGLAGAAGGASEMPDAPESPTATRSRILPLSARTPAALRALAEAWLPFLAQAGASAADLCYTAAQRRTHYDCRLAVVADSTAGLRDRLLAHLQDADLQASTVAGQARPEPVAAESAAARRIAFVFSGQGPQWHAMGRELLVQEPLFADVLAQCDARLRPLAGWSLLEELAAPGDRSRIGQTEIAQPALFALQAGLAALLRSWGIEPQAVVGHSVGEIAALHVAGALTLDDALAVACRRGRIMQLADGMGRMASLSLAPDEALPFLRPYGHRLSIGAINGPRSIVISGETAAVESVVAQLAARGIEHRLLPVQYAFHSPQMAPLQRRLADELAGLRAGLPSLPFYSTVRGALVDRPVDADYFAAGMREPVRFAAAVSAMAADGFATFVEIGPHPVLAASLTDCLDAVGQFSLPVATLRRGRPERESLLQACAQLYAAGASPDWAAIEPAPARVVTLPAYPWQRMRCWIRPTPVASATPALPAGRLVHPLLGRRLAVAGADAQYFEAGAQAEMNWLADHRIFGRLPLPAAAVLEIFHAAARAATGRAAPALAGLTVHRPLFLAESAAVDSRWQCVARAGDGESVALELHESLSGETVDLDRSWRLVATATADGLAPVPLRRHVGAPDAGPLDMTAIDVAAIDARFVELGVSFGAHFRCLSAVRRRDGFAEGWLELPTDLRHDADRYGLHPVLLDAALQLCSLAAPAGAAASVPAWVALPLGAAHYQLVRAAAHRLRAFAQVTEVAASGSFAADVTIESESGELVAVIEGARFAPAQAAAFAPDSSPALAAYDIAWEPLQAASGGMPADASDNSSRGKSAAEAAVHATGLWLLLTDESGIGEAIARRLRAGGGRVCVARPGDGFRRVGEDEWRIHPADPAHFHRWLQEAFDADGSRRLRGVMHLWSLDTATFAHASAGGADQEHLQGVGTALHLAQALAAIGNEAGCPLWLVTRGAQVVTAQEPALLLRPRAAGIWGLGSVIAIEHPELEARLVDLDCGGDPADQAVRLLDEVLAVVGASHNDDGSANPESRQVAIRGSKRFAPALVHRRSAAAKDSEQPVASVRLALGRVGTFDGIELPTTEATEPGPGEVRLRVVAAGLNFRDVLLVLGMYPAGEVPLGAECAGIVQAVGADVDEFVVGAAVFGFAPASMASEVVVPAAFLAPVPPRLGIEDAAATPVAFLTAWHGLHALAGIRAGDRVLVHAAAGGVGLAAIQVAQQAGAVVFATAGSAEKRALLHALGVAHVADSRSLSFVDAIRRATGGEGVDIVLNSLAGEFIRPSLALLSRGGRFLELGKRGILTPDDVARDRPDVRYLPYDLGSAALRDPSLVRPMLDRIVAGMQDGSFRPLPVTTFALAQAQDAFRYMAQARHIGKVVLRVGAHAAPLRGQRDLISSAATYWITGGLGGLGLATARWLAANGARHLMLTGRHAPGAAALDEIEALRASGVRVGVRSADASDHEQMRSIVDAIAASDAPLRGVVHAAGIVDDAILVHQQWQRCRSVLAGKADGAWLLHELTRGLDLDFFVLYSAAGVVLGAAGQGPYAAANAEIDALARARRRLGLPALSVAWGPWEGVGMAADLAARGTDTWSALGLGRIGAQQGLDFLERLLKDGATYAAVVPVHWPTFLAARAGQAHARFFRALHPEVDAGPAPACLGGGAASSGAASGAMQAAPSVAVLARLQALPAGQRRQALVEHLRERALQVLGLALSTPIDPKRPVKEIGLDSLMAVELRNLLTRSLSRQLPATLLFDYPTLDLLADYLMPLLGIQTAADRQPAPAPADPVAGDDELLFMSDDEAEALLLDELDGAAHRKAQ